MVAILLLGRGLLALTTAVEGIVSCSRVLVLEQELVEVHTIGVLLLAILVGIVSGLVVLQETSKEWSKHLLLVRWDCLETLDSVLRSLLLLLEHVHVRRLLITTLRDESLGSNTWWGAESRLLLLLGNATLRCVLLSGIIGSWDQISDEAI